MMNYSKEGKRIYILGGCQSDFARKISRENKGITDLFQETFIAAMTEVDLDPFDIDTCHVGNFAGELFAGQGHLGGLFAQAHPALCGRPAMRHEAACASGSMAILAATAELEAGRYDLACVLGIEEMRNRSGRDAAKLLGAAAWVGQEFTDTPWIWPAAFAEVMELYRDKYGLDETYLSEISAQNFANAKLNPNAQTRNWTLTPDHFLREGSDNPIIEGHLRKQDCSQLTDGAAVVFLATEERARQYAAKRGLDWMSLPYIEGWGHRVTQLGWTEKLESSTSSPYLFPEVRRCFEDAYRRAGISGPDEIDGLETHDCFSITQYMAIDHCGLTPPGQSHIAIDKRWTTMTGRFPINPSGGLIGLGHPVGATGVRMLLDAAKQVSGSAGAYQVDGAKRWLTYNVGGSTTTSAAFIVSRR